MRPHLFIIPIYIMAFLLLRYNTSNAINSVLRTKGMVGKESYNWDNGNTWKSIDNIEGKICYLIGLENGIALHHREIYYTSKNDEIRLESMAARNKLKASDIKFSELATLIDDFYKDDSNSMIPIVDAYICSIMKKRGVNQKELDIYVSELRKVYK